MNIFSYKNRKLFSGPHLLGTLLIIAGLFAFLSLVFFNNHTTTARGLGAGGGSIILGLVIISSYSGTLIDFTENKFKEYSSLSGYKYGEWATLPHITKIIVVSSSYVRSNKPNGISPTLSEKVTDFKILIYSNESMPLFKFIYSKKKEAVKNARFLASNLNVDLVLNIREGL